MYRLQLESLQNVMRFVELQSVDSIQSGPDALLVDMTSLSFLNMLYSFVSSMAYSCFLISIEWYEWIVFGDF
jgi:hypothetical protein